MGKQTVLNVVKCTVSVINTFGYNLLNELAFICEFIKLINGRTRAGVGRNSLIACEAVSVVSEVICISVNLSHSTSVIIRTVVVSVLSADIRPNAVIELTVCKAILVVTVYTYRFLNNHTVNSGIGCCIEVIPVVFNLLPSGDKLVVYSVVPFSVHFKQTGTRLILFTAVVDEFAVNETIVVTDCR